MCCSFLSLFACSVTHCLFVLCVCMCVWERERKGEFETTQEMEVNLRCNENANCLSRVNLRCQSASQYSTHNDSRSTQTQLGQITPPSYFPHPFQINQSPLSLCSLLLSILHSSIDFCHSSICLNCFVFIPPLNSFPPPHPEGDFVIGI